jgi:hypothetical protein
MMSFHLDSDHGGVDFSRFPSMKSSTDITVSQVNPCGSVGVFVLVFVRSNPLNQLIAEASSVFGQTAAKQSLDQHAAFRPTWRPTTTSAWQNCFVETVARFQSY